MMIGCVNMQSRMDKYNNNSTYTSRVQKNQALYEEVKNSSIEDFNVDSNVSVIGKNSANIDVDNLRRILDTKYSDNSPKRRSISLDYEEEEEHKPMQDTKEYDINVILKKAKEGKDVNYNKERLKSVRETQYEILNNLDLSAKKEPDEYEQKKKADEDNLMELINTITALELKNKNKVDKEVSQALDLFDDLNGGDEETEQPVQKIEIKKKEDIQPVKKEEAPVIKENIKEKVSPQKMVEAQKEHEEHVEETLSKLNININDYDEFSDVEKGDKSTFILKVMVFLIIILLIIGTVFIVNNMLGLGLFD